MRSIMLVAAIVLGFSHVARANHFYATADPQVVQAINEIIYVLGQGCNAGNAPACNAIPVFQQQSNMMLSAGYDCTTQGNQQACNFYQQNLWQLQEAYTQVQQAVQQGNLTTQYGSPSNGMGLTHEQRMQQIHNFGVQNQQNFQNRMNTMDNNHQQFLEYLRQ